MTIEQWLVDAQQDAYRRKMPELAELLEGLARATAALRAADWNDDAARKTPFDPSASSGSPRATSRGDSVTDDQLAQGKPYASERAK